MGKKKAKIGDNSVSHAEFKEFMGKLDKLETEKADIGADISQVYSDMKSKGYNVKAVRKLRKLMEQDEAARQEEATHVSLYAEVMGVTIDPYS